MNVLILGYHVDDTVNQLQALNPEWQIVWIGQEKQRQSNPLCQYSYEHLQYGKTGATVYTGCYSNIYENIFADFLYYQRMMTRVTGDGWIDWTFPDYINLFNIHYDFFASLFERHQFDLILFSNLAHEGYDCVPYLMAKALGIPTLMTIQSPFPNRFFCVTAVELFGHFSDMPFFDEPQPYLIEKKHFKPHPYLSPTPPYGINLRTSLEVLRLLLKKGPARFLMRYHRMRKYQKNLALLCHRQVNFNRPYIYFPLHMQPELTTSAIGGIYEDQVLAIEHLSKLIPPDWIIYVKENPTQTEQYRGDFFFKRLANIPNACLVSPTINTFDLIAHSQFVATITGTVGWEAVTGGKNVLVFGHAWYRTLPGVFEFNKQFSIKSILDFKIDHAAVEKKTGEILAKMLPGVVDYGYKIIHPDFDESENAKIVAQSITRCVNHILSKPS